VAGCRWVYEHLSPRIGVLKVSDDMLVEIPPRSRGRWRI